MVDSLLRAGSRAWRLVTPAPLRGLAQPVMAAVTERRVLAALASSEPEFRPGPLVVSGLFSEGRGISQAAHLTLAGLQAAGLQPVQHDLRPLIAAGPGANAHLPFDPGGVWLTHVNAPEAMHALSYLDPASWRGRYRIGFWVWELERVPAAWVRAARAFHEIWVPSRFVANAMKASGVITPIRVMPHPVALGAPPRRNRPAFQLAADDFFVLSMGDLRSSLTRKNLLGAISIYARAFPEPRPGCRMIVKVQSTDPHPAIDTAVSTAIAGRPDIALLADSLSTADAQSLIASADVILSPHRSEGFGLPLAEAFLAGVPALATGWSGNLDFMAEVPDLLIRHSLAPVADPHGIYKAHGQRWAEPDEQDAVAKLRRLAEIPALRTDLAAKGRKAVEGQASAWSREALSGSELARLAAKA
ncbi:MAG TPA: glycosyltransferase [Hyphomonadaceae bacterium]|nr:glycosyltransferase [Hyphomonadaceae bacterium]